MICVGEMICIGDDVTATIGCPYCRCIKCDKCGESDYECSHSVIDRHPNEMPPEKVN